MLRYNLITKYNNNLIANAELSTLTRAEMHFNLPLF